MIKFTMGPDLIYPWISRPVAFYRADFLFWWKKTLLKQRLFFMQKSGMK